MRKVYMPLMLLAVFVFRFSAVCAQSKLSPGTTHIMRALSKTPDATALQSSVLYTIGGETYIPAYIHTDTGFDTGRLTALGVQVNLVLGKIITARIPGDAVDAVAALDGVRYIDAATAVKPMMDVARAACGVDDVHAGTDLTGSFKGDGVVVGIIDMGFQYDHINFYDSSLSSIRIQRVWEQDWTGGTAPDGFSYGGEMTTDAELTTYLGDVTTSSHGCHVAGIAAGSYSGTDCEYYGVAPEADLVFVSYGSITENNVNISDALAYIYGYADSVGKPCVVNMSLGTQIGPHDGTSSFDQVCDALQGEGRLLVGSIGNFGNYDCHITKTFESADDAPLQTLVSYLDDVDEVGEMDVWGEEGMDMTVQVFVYDKYTGTKKDSIEVDASAADGSTTEYTWQSNAVGSVTVTTEVNPLNNKPHAYISLAIERFKSKSVVGLAVKPRGAGTVHAWADGNYIVFTDDGEDGMSAGDTDYTVAEIGGTGNSIITVGAYITRDYMWTESDATQLSFGETLGEIGTFSSHGPTIDGRMKPFITAPGGAIVSSLSNNDANIDDEYVVKTVTDNGSSNYFGLKEGTSMAAPFVTGVLATWLQANPALTPDEAKAIIQETAIQNDYTGEIGSDGDNSWGYGIIDAWNGIKKCIETSGISNALTTAPAVSMRRGTDNNIQLLFTGSNGNVRIDLLSVDGRIISSTRLGDVAAAGEVNISVPSAVHGVYMLRVTADGLNETYKITGK